MTSGPVKDVGPEDVILKIKVPFSTKELEIKRKHLHSRHAQVAVASAMVFVAGLVVGTQRRQRDPVNRIADILAGEKDTLGQSARNPKVYFQNSLSSCPVARLDDGGKVLYSEQAFWRTPEKPYRQRFLLVRPVKDGKVVGVDEEGGVGGGSSAAYGGDRMPPSEDAIGPETVAEVAVHGVSDQRKWLNHCKRPKIEQVQNTVENIDFGDHLMSVYLSTCDRKKKRESKPGVRARPCEYEGATPYEGYPTNFGGAETMSSEMTLYKGGAIDVWDRGYDASGFHVWGSPHGPYEYVPSEKAPKRTANALNTRF